LRSTRSEPHGVDLDHDGAGRHAGQVDPAALAVGQRLRRLDDAVHQRDQVGGRGVQRRRAGVVPADLEQVGQQRLEPVQLVLQQLGRPADVAREAGAAGEQHVGGHPDRGQRRAQLVRDVGDEPALHAREVLELADLALQRLGHRVERAAQAGQLVLAPHPASAPRAGRGQPLGRAGRQPDRARPPAG
jgi:hypothetical protein